MNNNTRPTKCPVCGGREELNNLHGLCRRGEDTGYRIPEAQVIINRAESIIRRASWGWKNP